MLLLHRFTIWSLAVIFPLRITVLTLVFFYGWVVRSVHSTGRHNLICFDTQATLKKGLDLITTDTLTSTDDGQFVILRGHYGVHNPGSSTTLISDAQIRRDGAIVNACPVDKVALW
jgi:hypothetical protein